MSKAHQYTDADGDTYTVKLSASALNFTLEYANGETGATELLIFKAEDAFHLANIITNAALEAGK